MKRNQNILAAIRAGAVDELELILEKADRECRYDPVYVAYAIECGRIEAARYLVSRGFPVNLIHPELYSGQVVRGKKHAKNGGLLADKALLDQILSGQEHIVYDTTVREYAIFLEESGTTVFMEGTPLFFLIITGSVEGAEYLMDWKAGSLWPAVEYRMSETDASETRALEYRTMRYRCYRGASLKQCMKRTEYMNAFTAAVLSESFTMMEWVYQKVKDVPFWDKSVSHAIASLSVEASRKFIEKYPKLAEKVRMKDCLTESNHVLFAYNRERYMKNPEDYDERMDRYLLELPAFRCFPFEDLYANLYYWDRKREFLSELPPIEMTEKRKVHWATYLEILELLCGCVTYPKQSMESSEVLERIRECRRILGLSQREKISLLEIVELPKNLKTGKRLLDEQRLKDKEVWVKYLMQNSAENGYTETQQLRIRKLILSICTELANYETEGIFSECAKQQECPTMEDLITVLGKHDLSPWSVPDMLKLKYEVQSIR